jgi:hypothetical protein
MSDIWFLTYQATPELGSEDFGTCGGAFVNCYIAAESQTAAESIAVPELTGFGWAITELTEAKLMEPAQFAYSERTVEFIEQAKLDGSVYCFHRWPVGG